MSQPRMAIEVRGLSKVFGQRSVLSDLSLDVAESDSVALTGANGAGKTTLLRCLAAVTRPTSGEVRWFGTSAAGNPAARRLIGMVAHESRLYPHLTLRENLIFAARMTDVPRPGQRVDQLLKSVGMEAHAQRLPAAISKGMVQRVAVARALVHDPPILLLDEPFSGLDAQGSDWLAKLLLELRGRGRTICFATHDAEKVRLLAGRVLEVRSGRVWECGACAGAGVAQAESLARAA